MRVKLLALVGLGLAALVAVFGCGSDSGAQSTGTQASSGPTAGATAQPTNGQSAPDVVPSPLAVRLTGDCKDGNAFHLDSSNFTPLGAYRTEALYPNGTPYTYLANGTADQNGKTPSWTWNCQTTANGAKDPEGTYKITITDVTTGRWAKVNLAVKY